MIEDDHAPVAGGEQPIHGASGKNSEYSIAFGLWPHIPELLVKQGLTPLIIFFSLFLQALLNQTQSQRGDQDFYLQNDLRERRKALKEGPPYPVDFLLKVLLSPDSPKDNSHDSIKLLAAQKLNALISERAGPVNIMA